MATMARNPNARSRDMIISLAVIMIPVLLIGWWFTMDDDSRPATVDVPGTLTRAQGESPYPLLTAEGLSDDWSAIRVAWSKVGDPWITGDPASSNSWQVGYLSPDDVYFGVQQRDAGSAEFIRTTTREAKELDGVVEAAGRAWSRYESPDERTRSLVSVDGDRTSIVTADTDFAQLEAFAASLVEHAPNA